MERKFSDEFLYDLADAALARVFGEEWVRLKRGREKVLSDFLEADIPASVYLSRIYAGNLQSYADSLR